MQITNPKDRPNIWFVETASEFSRANVRTVVALRKQFVPDPNQAAEHSYRLIEEDYKVSMPDEQRSSLSEGVVIACYDLAVRRAKPGTAVSLVAKNTVVLGNDSANELVQAYRDFISGKVPRLKSLEPKPEVKKMAKPAKGTVLEELISKHPRPTPKKNGFWIDPATWLRLLQLINRNEQILLVGDSGVGKTELTALLARTFNYGFKPHDMSTKQDAVAALCGQHRYDAAKGGSYFDKARFVEDIQGRNLVLLDELSRAPFTASNMLLPLLDSRRELYLDTAPADTERIVKAGKECLFIATANIGSSFTGASIIDEAITNRFRVIKLDYPPVKEEAAILHFRTKIDLPDAEIICQVAQSIREQYQSGNIALSVSTRHTLDAAQMVVDGYAVIDSINNAFIPQYQGDDLGIVTDLVAAA